MRAGVTRYRSIVVVSINVTALKLALDLYISGYSLGRWAYFIVWLLFVRRVLQPTRDLHECLGLLAKMSSCITVDGVGVDAKTSWWQHVPALMCTN